MATQRQNNQGGSQTQETQLRKESPTAPDDSPTDGSEAQRLREQRQKQEKAEGERPDELGFSKDDESQWG